MIVTPKKIDLLNIFLMLLSLGLAFYIPFQLLLFSYAVLGPLHYLTEIQWLHRNSFFLAQKEWIIALLTICCIVSLPLVVPNRFTLLISKFYSLWVYVGLLFATILIFVNTKNYKKQALWLLVGLVLGGLLYTFLPFQLVLIGVFVPTIVHVYFFTFLFMVYGNQKTKSFAGWCAAAIMLTIPLLIYFIPLPAITISQPLQTTFENSGLAKINQSMLPFFSQQPFNIRLPLVIKIQVFIAFCYTYHYLNWFSKTSLIGWSKNLSNTRMVLIIFIWLLSVGLYYYNFKMGITYLFFLSFSHVLLELPLNMVTIKSIAISLKPKM